MTVILGNGVGDSTGPQAEAERGREKQRACLTQHQPRAGHLGKGVW